MRPVPFALSAAPIILVAPPAQAQSAGIPEPPPAECRVPDDPMPSVP